MIWALLVSLAAAQSTDSVEVDMVKVSDITPFTVDLPFSFDYTARPFEVRSGHLVTFEADPDLARPRQTRQPVLYAGAWPVQVLYTAPDARCVVGVVPDVVDLTKAPMFFGPAELPERIDTAQGERALAGARAAGMVASVSPIRPAIQSPSLSALMARASRACEANTSAY